MLIQTKSFGQLEIDERQIIHFPSGIFGFEEYKDYALMDSGRPPFYLLQSLDDPDLAFIILSPEVFRPDFKLDLAEGELDNLQWAENEDLLIMAIVTVPRDGGPMTANLQGPVLINRYKRLGKQVIQLSNEWKTKHNILDEMAKIGAR